MVALRKIADGMMNGEEEDGDSEEAGEAAGSKESVPRSRRVSWLKRGKMAPLYDDDEDYGAEDDDEGDNDDVDDEGDNDDEEDDDEGYSDDEGKGESESEVCGV